MIIRVRLTRQRTKLVADGDGHGRTRGVNNDERQILDRLGWAGQLAERLSMHWQLLHEKCALLIQDAERWNMRVVAGRVAWAHLRVFLFRRLSTAFAAVQTSVTVACEGR